MHIILSEILLQHQNKSHSIVEFNGNSEKLISLDFTKNNTDLTEKIFNDIDLFSEYISQKLKQSNAKFGIGGYLELRELYGRSNLFDNKKMEDEPRRLHLGIDIWGNADTKIFAPLDAVVHSFAFNNQNGDYGATIILQHQLENVIFYTLYGHLALKNIKNLFKGKSIKKGEYFANFGEPSENGNWPPHLHFQIILDLEGKEGDYPGVCSLSDKEKYAFNCPNPNLILQLNQFI